MKIGNTFEKGALLLVCTNLFAKVLGAIYRIPLTNLLGVEGIGLYQIIIPTLLLALALTSNYIPIVTAKSIAYMGGDRNESQKIFHASMKFVTLITIIAGIIIGSLSTTLASIQHNEDLAFGYLLIIPTIILSGIKSVYRGVFFGYKEMVYPSFSQLIEQIFKMGVSLTLIILARDKGVMAMVYGAIIGLFAGEVVGFLFLLISSIIKYGRRKIENNNPALYFRLISTESFPIMISGIIYPLVSFIDSFLIVNLLIRSGESEIGAIASYGLLQGPVYSLINLPIMIAISITMAIIPLLTSLFSKQKIDSIKQKTSTSIKMCLAIVIPACIGLCIIIKPVLHLLYPRLSQEEIIFCSKLFIFSSLDIITLSLLEVMTSILQSVNESKTAAKNLLFAAMIKFILEIILVKIIGIYGVIISNISFYLVALLLNVAKYRSLIGKDQLLIKNIGKIVLSSVIMAVVIYLVNYGISNYIAKILMGVFVGFISYFVVIIMIKVFNKEEMKSMPGGKIILKLLKEDRKND